MTNATRIAESIAILMKLAGMGKFYLLLFKYLRDRENRKSKIEFWHSRHRLGDTAE
jgi:hypothetical protein